jgi:hypothetical protein
MFYTPPPGYNTSAINYQNVGPFNVPGQQGNVAQGYYANPFRSSYSLPSSFSIPSSIDYPQQYSGPPQSPVAQMAKALRGNKNG